MKVTMSKVLNVLLLLVLGAFLFYKFLMPSQVATGEKAPEIEAQLLNGEDFKLSDLQGNYVLVDFWGSWCPPCRQANKKLVPLYKKYEGKKFKVLSVAIEKKSGSASRAIAKDNLYWDLHIVQENRFVLQNSIAMKYNVTDLPTTVLINPEGNIMGTNISFENIDKMLSERL